MGADGGDLRGWRDPADPHLGRRGVRVRPARVQRTCSAERRDPSERGTGGEDGRPSRASYRHAASRQQPQGAILGEAEGPEQRCQLADPAGTPARHRAQSDLGQEPRGGGRWTSTWTRAQQHGSASGRLGALGGATTQGAPGPQAGGGRSWGGGGGVMLPGARCLRCTRAGRDRSLEQSLPPPPDHGGRARHQAEARGRGWKARRHVPGWQPRPIWRSGGECSARARHARGPLQWR